jgi:phenylalanyl-tRNA synthetase beta chain
MAVTMKNVKVGESPTWLKAELSRLGSKPVNNVVDISNYVMHLTGQPTHAYDLSKLNGGTISARFAKKGETIALLNGKTIELTSDDMVIADSKRPVGVAGVMGGSETEVDANTTEVLLEVASFDMYTIRRSAMRHGLFTDAFTRFSKGQSPLQNDRALAKFIEMLREMVGAELSSDVADLQSSAVQEMGSRYSVHPGVVVSGEFINSRLGTSLSNEQIANILRNVEMAVLDVEGGMEITAPFWRTDIEQKEDVVEEVGRLYGFDQLDLKLPLRTTKPAGKNLLNDFKTALRNKLAAGGANEVLSYSFVHGDLLKKTGLDDVDKWAFHLRNALSPDLQYYRTSLLPSLLSKVHPNIKSDMVRSDDNEFVLFEIGKAHVKKHVDEEKLPTEFERLALVVAADEKTQLDQFQ